MTDQNFVISQGDLISVAVADPVPVGVVGFLGPAGAPATVSVGTVSTGSPGSSAVVTNVGTSSAAVLNFTIPRGDTGAAGSGANTDSINEGSTNLYFTAGRAAAAAPVQSVAGKTGAVALVKADVGLGSVDNTADSAKSVLLAARLATARTINGVAFDGSANITVVDSTREATANKNQVNGYAGLDAAGLVPSSLLPSYVDDVLEFVNLAGFPVSGETGKIYVDKATAKIYRWSGSVYVEISPSPGSTDSVIEGSTNLYFTNARAASAAPVQSVSGRTGAVTLTKTDVGLGSADNTADAAKAVLSATKLATARTINGVAFDGTANVTVWQRTVSSVSSAVTLGAAANTDYIALVGSGGSVTLPSAVGNVNRYTIKNADVSNTTVATTSSQTIDGSTTAVLTPNTSIDVVSDGANWRVI
jgi:hypothetical protein